MSGKAFHVCDCSNIATHKTPSGWECERCQRLNKLAGHFHEVVSVMQLTGEEWADSRARELEYFRIYNHTVRPARARAKARAQARTH